MPAREGATFEVIEPELALTTAFAPLAVSDGDELRVIAEVVSVIG